MSSQKRVLQQPVASSSSGATSIEDTSPQKKQKQASTFEDFPVDDENPFETDCYGSDITLIVEGKKLHTHRLFLSMYCSYFRVLLASDHFSEAGAKEIELKGSKFIEVKYNVVVKFLRQLYPVHSFKSITDDQTLKDLFSLAEYFQCQHVRTKCESYIRQQIQSVKNGSQLSVLSALLYLYLCEKYQVKTFIEDLLKEVSLKNLYYIQDNMHFRVLTPEMQRDVFQRRVRYVEDIVSKQKTAAQQLLYKDTFVGEQKCQSCRTDARRGYFVCNSCSFEFMKGFP